MLLNVLDIIIDKLIKWIVIPAILIYIGYLLVPLFFKYFIAPKFNASYKYSKKDFYIENQIKLAVSAQENVPKVSVDQTTGLYVIEFGKGRRLLEGYVGVNSNHIWYSNKESLSASKRNKKLVLKNSNEVKGNDDIGGFKSVELKFQLEGQKTEIIVLFKIYEGKPFIIFEMEFPNGLGNTSLEKLGTPITSFPNFINEGPNKNILTWRNAIFAPPERKLLPTTSPVVFYDNELNIFIVSPLDGFLNALISKDKTDQIHCGIQGEVVEIPEGYSQKFVIYFGKGINSSMMELGDLLYKYHRKPRPDKYRNICLQKVGFWTDNGAHYYYNPKRGKCYDETLLEVNEHFKQNDIPIGYYNLDSWWYVKKKPHKAILTVFRPIFRLTGGGLYGNTLRWEADPEVMKTDLKTFYQQIKVPFTAHNRRWDARSEYLKDYNFVTYENHAVPVEKDFWDHIMKFAKESGIEAYEQDWMKTQMNSIPQLRLEIGLAEKWLESMALAAADHEVDVFYCMSTPAMFLYSIKHENISFGRCSNDYNARWPKNYKVPFTTQTNILFNTVGMWPHDDCFRSSKAGIVYHEKYPVLKALIQILTAGIVAPSDRMDNVDRDVLMHTCRNDGFLLKPDRAITANDLMFTKHAKYYICDTWTIKNGLTWSYFVILNLWPRRVKDREIIFGELGVKNEDFILYDYFTKDVLLFKKSEILNIKLKNMEYKYYILAPILSNGMALIGNPEKFVSCSNKQFPMINATGNSLTFEIEDIENATVKVLVYSPTKPESVNIGGKPQESWLYNENKKVIELKIEFKKTGTKKVIVEK